MMCWKRIALIRYDNICQNSATLSIIIFHMGYLFLPSSSGEGLEQSAAFSESSLRAKRGNPETLAKARLPRRCAPRNDEVM
jgi:hypothetical protein